MNIIECSYQCHSFKSTEQIFLLKFFMKKIIVAFDGLKFSESARDYAIYTSKSANAHLVGIFLDDITYTSYKIYELISEGGVSETKLKQYDAKDTATREKAVADFETACHKAGIKYSIHHDRKIAIHELLHESIYADFMIIDSKETLTHYEERLPTRFIRDLLSEVQCPVLLVTKKFQPFKKIVLLYDGEPSSVHAIKMFSYMFPHLSTTETEVLAVKNTKATLHLPDNKLMKEFAKRHYPNAFYKVLKGVPEVEIAAYLKDQLTGTLAVLGAYRRSATSRLFRQSMADVLMKEVKSPLFIAHNK
jgi:nucleotide-binding universal stress UspA family protein